MTIFAEVALPLPITKTFFYIVPDVWKEQTKVGMRVLVPFGKRTVTAFVVNLRKRIPEGNLELKELNEILDEKPVFSPSFLSFARKVSDYYYTFLGELLQTSLPPSYIIRSKTTISISEKGKAVLAKENLSKEERALLSLLLGGTYTPLFIRRKLGPKYSSTRLSRMEKKGYISIKSEVKRTKKRKTSDSSGVGIQSQLEIDFSLDKKTKTIAERIYSKIGSEFFSPFLLIGSRDNREAVYFYVIRQVLAKGKKVLFLVPEISLAKYPLEKIRKRIGENVAFLHSQMSDGARVLEWKKVQDGKADVVVGSRSALFSQVSNLGLIIVDEEQDDSYYQQESPSYDARKGAWLRAKEEKALLLYGSAEPTVETFYRAKKGSYLLNMDELEEKKKVYVVEEKVRGRALGPSLIEKIKDNLKKGKQIILFINRRGYAPLLICTSCKYISKCPKCHISLVYHKKEERLVCHSCNYSIPKVEVCPKCKARIIRMIGVGIEAVEEELKRLFPQKKIASMASDETKARAEREKKILDFSRGKIDILLGTQLLAHQVDVPPVSLVGILYPETQLGFSDYRASKKTFQTINQMKKFCEDDENAEVVIQTSIPSNFSINSAASGDYVSFYKEEIRYRRLMNYPPFSYITAVVFRGENIRTLARKSREFQSEVKKRTQEIEVLGPALGLARRVGGGSSIQMILKAKKKVVLDRVLKEYLKETRFRGSILQFWG